MKFKHEIHLIWNARATLKGFLKQTLIGILASSRTVFECCRALLLIGSLPNVCIVEGLLQVRSACWAILLM